MKRKLKKIKTFFKKRKKIFKPILYNLGGIGSIVGVWLIAIIISIGGLTNFGERALFEYIIAHQESKNKDYCETFGGTIGGIGAVSYAGYGGFKHYFHRIEIQFLDYYGEYKDLSNEEAKKAESFLPFYKGNPETQVQLAINFKNKSKSDFNHCTFTRLLLRAAHQNNEVAKKILSSYHLTMMASYLFIDDDKPFFLDRDFYLFRKYENKINSEKDLDNPALTYVYAEKIRTGGKTNKYYVQAADEGYLLAMERYLYEYDEKLLKKGDCGLILKYNNYLADQLSLIHFFNVLHANMGKITSTWVRPYYKCLNEVTNFSKAYSMAERIPDILSEGEDTPKIRGHIWSAFMELNGLGTKQNYEKAFEKFKICSFDKNHEINADKCALYYSYMNYKGLGSPINAAKGKSLLISYVEKKDKENLDFVTKNSDKNNIEFLEQNIKTIMSKWFENPELFKTLNYLGEPK